MCPFQRCPSVEWQRCKWSAGRVIWRSYRPVSGRLILTPHCLPVLYLMRSFIISRQCELFYECTESTKNLYRQSDNFPHNCILHDILLFRIYDVLWQELSIILVYVGVILRSVIKRLKVVFCFSRQCEFSPLRMNFHRSSVCISTHKAVTLSGC